jgi:hypothetical protein
MDAWLARRQPAVLTVVGPRGSGKSFVTDTVVSRAAALGWNITPYREGRGIRAGAGTTDRDLATDIATALDIDPLRPGRRVLRSLARDLVDVGRRTPLLVVLDPFAPGDELLDHIVHDFLATLRGSASPVVVLVVSRTSLRDVLPVDFELAVTVPAEDEVRTSIARVVSGAGIELAPGELDAYVTAARRSPRVLKSLLTVLPYGAVPVEDDRTAALS